jgi:ketosteroid isomerase-like protein
MRWFEVQFGHLWTMREGKIASMELFPRREQALEAIGLKP